MKTVVTALVHLLLGCTRLGWFAAEQGPSK